jgi:hypothetical protein
MEGYAMASIHKEMMVDASLEEVWAAIRDVGGIHTRPARQFVVDTRLDGESRLSHPSGSPTCCPTIWRTSSMA